MASRRKLKKAVNDIANRTFILYMVSIPDVKKANQEKALDILDMLYALKGEFIGRINHTQPGNVKGYYKKFHNDFDAKINEILDALVELNDED